ncbi:DUF4262 domain-containing protein [Polaribacter porphyrae]|uniref:DUF4262 domain-containing protein n=1 Tax=Polaribacter porphyrae TaxID=1137780 RepID=A0A2S7WN75_9FLAO|nr:DUF4262 domain-containing protein [Polaribacter porphyrae]PQJ79053.1 hypothetical protein BTO18_07660 [Polaribacter porphyrae]
MNKKKYFKRIYNNIDKYGFNTTSLLEEKGFTPFGYSTGIYKNFKIPELFISGLLPRLNGDLIHYYVEKYKFKEVPINEKIEGLSDRFPVYFIELDNNNLTEYTLTSIKYYKNAPYKYLQLIFPDLNGYFPFEKEYNYDQEILGDISKLKRD